MMNGDAKVEHNMRQIMIDFGFDFSLLGSIYIYEMFREIIENAKMVRVKTVATETKLANKHNINIKTINRDIRWSIGKAYNKGLLKNIPYFEMSHKLPSTKQVLYWLHNYYLTQYA